MMLLNAMCTVLFAAMGKETQAEAYGFADDFKSNADLLILLLPIFCFYQRSTSIKAVDLYKSGQELAENETIFKKHVF